MMQNKKRLVLEQLEKTLSKFATLKSIPLPPKGWIRAVREALGMSGVQLARRIGVTPPRVTKLEKDELSGAVTLKSMRQVAEALDCVFVYTLVPRDSLEGSVKNQAFLVAQERLKRSFHTMRLENQQLTDEEMKKALNAAVEELVKTMPKNMWDIMND